MSEHHKLVVGVESLEEDFSWYNELLPLGIENLNSQNNFGVVINTSQNLIYLASALDKEDLQKYFHVTAELYKSIFAFTYSDQSEIDFMYEGKSEVVVKKEKFNDSHKSDLQHYINAVYCAALSNNNDALDVLMNTPLDKIKMKSSGLDEFFNSYANFLVNLITNSEELADSLLKALEDSMPEKVKSASYDYLEANYISTLEAWAALVQKDSENLSKVSKESLETFISYWNSSKKMDKGDNHQLKERLEGYLDMGLSTVMKIAKINDLEIDLESEYLFVE